MYFDLSVPHGKKALILPGPDIMLTYNLWQYEHVFNIKI